MYVSACGQPTLVAKNLSRAAEGDGDDRYAGIGRNHERAHEEGTQTALPSERAFGEDREPLAATSQIGKAAYVLDAARCIETLDVLGSQCAQKKSRYRMMNELSLGDECMLAFEGAHDQYAVEVAAVVREQ